MARKGQNLAAELRRAVRASGQSLTAVAERSGVPLPVLSRFMSGVRDNLRLDTIEKLMGPLGLRITDGRGDRAGSRQERKDR